MGHACRIVLQHAPRASEMTQVHDALMKQ